MHFCIESMDVERSRAVLRRLVMMEAPGSLGEAGTASLASFVGIPMNIALLFLRRLMPGMGLGIGGRPMLPVYPLAALPDEFGEADAGRKEGRKAALLVTSSGTSREG